MRKISIECLIEQSKKIHGCKIDYSLVNTVAYKNTHDTKIPLRCLADSSHGVFYMSFHNHIGSKQCCPKCSRISSVASAAKVNSISLEKRINECKTLYGDKYDYSLIDSLLYSNSHKKVPVICKKHGKFLIDFHNHISNSQGCPKCTSKIVDTALFIEKARKIHGDDYDYSQSKWVDDLTNVEIVCKKCKKIFSQRPGNHIHGCGCPRCRMSKGEKRVEKFLKKTDIKYEIQYRFDKCKGKRKKLPFDFYIPEKNMCIEYDGEGHYRPLKFNKNWNVYSFEDIKRNDEIKTCFCFNNNIKLVRIPYYDFNKIEEILRGVLNG